MKFTKSVVAPIIDLIYPNNCKVCGKSAHQYGLCMICINALEPIDSMHPFLRDWKLRLYSRFPIQWYVPLFDINSNDKAHEIIKAIKYNNAPETAQFLGRKLGEVILKSGHDLPDAIVPVPLHREKLRRRGYNQAEQIGIGLSDVLGIPLQNNICKRKINTVTQTKMNRWQRLDNMKSVFSLSIALESCPKSVLLCDDVLTTGSTLESLRRCLPSSTKISVATLGVA
jgi:ComF family protein